LSRMQYQLQYPLERDLVPARPICFLRTPFFNYY
jgi:hypothetical protein